MLVVYRVMFDNKLNKHESKVDPELVNKKKKNEKQKTEATTYFVSNLVYRNALNEIVFID